MNNNKALQPAPWAVHVLESTFLQSDFAEAEDDVITLAPLPGGPVVTSFGQEVAQSGGCCPSGSCCASGSCCQSGSACVTVDEDTTRNRHRRRNGAGVSNEKRLWPIPV
jgi:hypothetical protein